MNQISLQRAQAADEGFLYQVYASTRQEELAQVPWTPLQKSLFLRRQHQAQLSHYRTYYPTATFDLILVQDHPAGRIFIQRGVEEIRLMDIALLPAYRNQGIGTLLIRDLLKEAEANHQFIGLHVEQFNRAYQLYQRLGFRDVEMRGIYMYMTWMAEHHATQKRDLIHA
jgi:ribosomal protein S18 acetylase RimI-like enzyme